MNEEYNYTYDLDDEFTYDYAMDDRLMIDDTEQLSEYQGWVDDEFTSVTFEINNMVSLMAHSGEIYDKDIYILKGYIKAYVSYREEASHSDARLDKVSISMLKQMEIPKELLDLLILL